MQRLQPLWAEQDPEDWWRAAERAVAALRQQEPRALAAVRGIKMGCARAVPNAPATGRCARRFCGTTARWRGMLSSPAARRAPRDRGNFAMPGFTAPKLLWVATHEPDAFSATAHVLLPKDWMRLRLTGEHVAEMSDASGTLWLDVGARAWSPELLAATGLDLAMMPRLVEGSAPSGTLRRAVADAWGLPPDTVVAGGGGDNAAGAIGVGSSAPATRSSRSGPRASTSSPAPPSRRRRAPPCMRSATAYRTPGIRCR